MAYAWVLAAYPKDYRRRHGAELLEPMLAESRRPTVREVANLWAHGLRTRLGRPTSRTVVAAAMLVTVITGLFGAAFGSWAGWQTAGPLPSPARTRALLADVLPGPAFGPIAPPPTAKFTHYGQALSWRDADDLLVGEGADLLLGGDVGVLLGDGGGYQAAETGTWADLPADTDRAQLIRTAASRLAATGWTVSATVSARASATASTSDSASGDAPQCADPVCLRATRDGLALTLETTPDLTVSADFTRTAPLGARFGAVAGGLLAGVFAFLVFGAASRRSGRPDHPARLAAVIPFGLALLCWWAPALAAVVLLAPSVHGRVPGDGPHLWDWLGQPVFSSFFLAGVVFAGLSLMLAGMAPRPELGRDANGAAPTTVAAAP